MKYNILLSLILICAMGCKDMVQDDPLSLIKETFTGSQLRVDGYYYRKVNTNYFPECFFYENGSLLYLGGNFYDFSEIDDYIQRAFLNRNNYSNSKLSWGLYNIDGQDIKFERWYPDPPLKAYVKSGEIINDTTFIITKSYRIVNGKKTDVSQANEIYHFKEFSPKPDSTNSVL